ncbi:hypothetical protein WG926_23220 [Tistrella sp. BH-R2-4]|uniref:Uncharacterized protein n=1 Tax=Tistrella arctica TaxID=3133430 RepID=A0ABU9YQZ8_9PROT
MHNTTVAATDGSILPGKPRWVRPCLQILEAGETQLAPDISSDGLNFALGS